MASRRSNDSLIQQYRPYIRQYLVPSHVLPDLVSVIGRENDVRKIERQSRTEAVEKLLTLLMGSNEPGWFQTFLLALEKNGFERLGEALKQRREIKDTRVFEELITVFNRSLCNVNPKDICLFLIEHGTITTKDYNDIKRAIRNDGENGGMELLLLRLPIHKNHWFADLIRALKGSGDKTYISLAEELEPVISKACDQGNDYDVMSATQELNENFQGAAVAASSPNSFDGALPRASAETRPRDARKEGTVSEALMICEEYESAEGQLGAGNVKATRFERAEGGGLERTLAPAWIEYTRPLRPLHRAASASYSTSSLLEDEATTVKSRLVDEENHSLRSVPNDGHRQEEEILNNLSATCKMKNIIEKRIPGNISSACNGKSVISRELRATNLGNEMECQEGRSDLVCRPRLELLAYERELIKSASEDQNVIIVVPRDCNKMTVALHLTEEHLGHFSDGKVIFLVPTSELVLETATAYAANVKDFKTRPIRDLAEANEADEVIAGHDIIITTSDILLKAVRQNTRVSLRLFTLMVFDECQLAAEDHPYTKVMMEYLTETRAEGGNQLPQVVGITTSLCISRARHVSAAVSDILSLCAIFDATGRVATVEERKNPLNKPREEKIQTSTRMNAPCGRLVITTMSRIEDFMKQYAERRDLHPLIRLLERSATRGSDEYEDWISRVHKEAARIKQQHIRSPVYAYLRHLKIYNESLLINEHCRTADVLDHIQNAFGVIQNDDADTDQRLDQLFKECVDQLNRFVAESDCENPKLTKLAELILAEYRRNQNLRAVVFCKTDELTKYLKEWIGQSRYLSVLKARRLTGARKSVGSTQYRQQDALSLFENGKYNILLATSKAMDTSKCHLVIKYGCLEKQITVVRAEGSCGRDRTQNQPEVRVDILNEAIREVVQMPDEQFEEKILDLQRAAKREKTSK